VKYGAASNIVYNINIIIIFQTMETVCPWAQNTNSFTYRRGLLVKAAEKIMKCLRTAEDGRSYRYNYKYNAHNNEGCQIAESSFIN